MLSSRPKTDDAIVCAWIAGGNCLFTKPHHTRNRFYRKHDSLLNDLSFHLQNSTKNPVLTLSAWDDAFFYEECQPLMRSLERVLEYFIRKSQPVYLDRELLSDALDDENEIRDDSKFFLFYAKVNQLAKFCPNKKIGVHIYDHDEELLSKLKNYLENNSKYILERISVYFHHYANNGPVRDLGVVQGTGYRVNVRYAETILTIYRDFVEPTKDGSTRYYLIKLLEEIMQRRPGIDVIEGLMREQKPLRTRVEGKSTYCRLPSQGQPGLIAIDEVEEEEEEKRPSSTLEILSRMASPSPVSSMSISSPSSRSHSSYGATPTPDERSKLASPMVMDFVPIPSGISAEFQLSGKELLRPTAVRMPFNSPRPS